MLFFVAAIAWGLCLQLAAKRATLTINYGTSNQRYLIAGGSPRGFSMRCDGSSSDANLVQLKKIETGHFIDPFIDTDYHSNSRIDMCSTSPSITWTLRSVTKEIEGTYMCRMISCISSKGPPTYSNRSYVFVFGTFFVLFLFRVCSEVTFRETHLDVSQREPGRRPSHSWMFILDYMQCQSCPWPSPPR